MKNIQKINENIYRLTMPYKDIFTTVYTIKTDNGILFLTQAVMTRILKIIFYLFLTSLKLQQI